MRSSVFGLAVVSAFALASAAQASLVITEAHPTGSSGSVGSDWFELTNLGAAPIDISGYRFDDNSNSFAASQPLQGVTIINPGESVIFIESAAPLTSIPLFRTKWSLSASVQVGSYTGSGLGLSSSADAVNVFTAGGGLVANVSFGAATSNVTFGFNPVTSTFGGLSVAGVFGAYESAAPAEVGSPGLIPTPGAAALLGLAGLVAGRRRR